MAKGSALAALLLLGACEAVREFYCNSDTVAAVPESGVLTFTANGTSFAQAVHCTWLVGAAGSHVILMLREVKIDPGLAWIGALEPPVSVSRSTGSAITSSRALISVLHLNGRCLRRARGEPGRSAPSSPRAEPGGFSFHSFIGHVSHGASVNLDCWALNVAGMALGTLQSFQSTHGRGPSRRVRAVQVVYHSEPYMQPQAGCRFAAEAVVSQLAQIGRPPPQPRPAPRTAQPQPNGGETRLTVSVRSYAQLVSAAANPEVGRIVIGNDLILTRSLHLDTSIDIQGECAGGPCVLDMTGSNRAFVASFGVALTIGNLTLLNGTGLQGGAVLAIGEATALARHQIAASAGVIMSACARICPGAHPHRPSARRTLQAKELLSLLQTSISSRTLHRAPPSPARPLARPERSMQPLPFRLYERCLSPVLVGVMVVRSLPLEALGSSWLTVRAPRPLPHL